MKKNYREQKLGFCVISVNQSSCLSVLFVWRVGNYVCIYRYVVLYLCTYIGIICRIEIGTRFTIHKKQIQKLKSKGKANYALLNAPCNCCTQPSADISHHRWVKQKFELAPKNNTLLQTISRIFFYSFWYEMHRFSCPTIGNEEGGLLILNSVDWLRTRLRGSLQ